MADNTRSRRGRRGVGGNADPLWNDYQTARIREWRKNGVTLTEREFLQTIDPMRRYTDANARDYMRRLATGEWSSKNVMARSFAAGGRRYNLHLKDGSGLVTDSITLQTVRGRSLHEIYMSGDLERQVDRAMQKRFHKRLNDLKLRRPELFDDDGELLDDIGGEGIDSPGHDGSQGLAAAGFIRLMLGEKLPLCFVLLFSRPLILRPMLLVILSFATRRTKTVARCVLLLTILPPMMLSATFLTGRV